MAGTWKWYGQGVLNFLNGNIDASNDTFKIMLTSSSYTPNQDTHADRADVTNEVAPSGSYAEGGGVVTVTPTYDAASNEVRLVVSDVAFTSATITARTAVLYKSTGVAADDLLIGYCTEAADVSSTSGTFTVDNPAGASLKITVAS